MMMYVFTRFYCCAVKLKEMKETYLLGSVREFQEVKTTCLLLRNLMLSSDKNHSRYIRIGGHLLVDL